MSQRISVCPLCNNPFSKYSPDGRIGFCEINEKWIPCEDSAVAVAAASEANEKYERERKEREDAAKKKAADIARRKAEERKRKAAMKVVAVLAALAVVAFAVFWFAIRPGMKYKDADALLNQGEYEQARSAYAGLNGYSDSAAKITLCDAFIALQGNDIESALDKLDKLEADGSGLSDGLKISLCDVVANWKRHGISAEALLSLLARAGDFDPKGTLDLDTLSTQAHIALADDGHVLETHIVDANGDGEDDLIVLKDDYTVTAYQMQASGNAKVTLDRTLTGKCLVAFGDDFAAKDADKAFACYQAAYEASPDEANAAKLSAAYMARATASESREDYTAALEEAETAYEIANTQEAFAAYCEMMLRRCYAETDKAESIRLWDEFSAANAAVAQKYGMEDTLRANGAELRLASAEELASWKDPACADMLRSAREYGADITAALENAIDRFEIGLPRLRLRQLAQEVAADDADALSAQTELLREDLQQALSAWKSLGIAPQEVFGLLNVPEAAELPKADTERFYREALDAALAEIPSAGTAYFDWNGDDREEAMLLTEEGELKAYAVRADELVSVWSDTPDFPVGALTELDGRLIVAEAEDKTGFAVYAYGNKALEKRASASGLQDYVRNETGIDYGILLEGSIDRFVRYHYDLATAPVGAERVELDWQKDNYPQPASAADAVVRYFEALYYGSADEALLLTSPVAFEDGTFPAGFAAPAIPDALDAIHAAAYESQGDAELFEVAYPAGGEAQRLYVAAVKTDAWRIAGIANRFATAELKLPAQLGGQLIALNGETVDHLADAKDQRVYRLLLSGATRLQIVWKAGEKASDRESFQVGLYAADNLETPIIAYNQTLSPKSVTEPPLFLPAGVYYVAVSPLRYQDCDFTLKVLGERGGFMEVERNNSFAEANYLLLNTTYAGSLFEKTDIDIYTFTLEQSSAVRAVLSAEAGSGRAVRYRMALAGKADAQALTSGELAGSVREAATESVYLAPGEYMVQVEKGDSWTGGEYFLRVEAEAAANSEIEGNDTPETATPISVNEEYAGTIAKSGDVDHFTFALANDAVVQLRFSFDAVESSSKTYVLTLQQDGKDLVSYNVGGKETQKVFTPYMLRAGSYTVKVENPRFVAQGYRLTVVAQSMDNVEQEPNDALAQANALTNGVPVAGLLFSDADVDTYKLALDAESIVTMDIRFEKLPASGNVYTLTLEQNGRRQGSWTVPAEAGYKTISMQIPAGEYNLTVKSGGAWSSTVYTLSAAVSAVRDVAVGETVTGTLSWPDEPFNVLRLKLDAYAEIAPTLKLSGDAVKGRAVMTLTPKSGKALERVELTPEQAEKYMPVWRLDAGEYFIQFYAAEEAVSYELALLPSEIPTAVPGLEISGALFSEDEVASVKLSFIDTTDVTLTFNFEAIASTDEAYTITLDQGLKEVWRAPIAGNLGAYQVTIRVPTGEYLLHIHGAKSMAGKVYTLRLDY